MNDDPLADLGLDVVEQSVAQELPVEKPTTMAAAIPQEKKVSAPVSDNSDEADDLDEPEIEIGLSEFVPTARRNRVSKYPFDKLDPPRKVGDKILYTNFLVKFTPQSGDAGKFKKTITSAAQQANRKNVDTGKYFPVRFVVEGGVFIGVRVFRTDKRPK